MQKQVVIKSNESLILTAPVMIPGAKDCDYWRGEDPFTVEEIKAFKESYDEYGFIDKYHTVRSESTANKNNLVADALKSFLLEEQTTYAWLDGTTHTYPKGTWMLTSEVTDSETIQQAKRGMITGYSPSVFEKNTAELIRAALKSNSFKSSEGGLIKDIINPKVGLVSLVRKPCQSGNKFCKIKNDDIMSNKVLNITLGNIHFRLYKG